MKSLPNIIRPLASITLILLALSGCRENVEKSSAYQEQKRKFDSLVDSLNADIIEMDVEMSKVTKARDTMAAETSKLKERIEELEAENENIKSELKEKNIALQDVQNEEAEIEAIRRSQKIAWAEYEGTILGDLMLENGRLYEQAKVRSVSATGISIAHKSGRGTIPFEDLPDEIRQACLYDSRVAKIVRNEKLSQASGRGANTRLAGGGLSSKATRASVPESRRSAAEAPPEKKKAARPQGFINCIVSSYENVADRDDSHNSYKTVNVEVGSNVDATLTFAGRENYTERITAGRKIHTFKFQSAIRGRYKATLKSGSGVLLDQETNLRKTGTRRTTLGGSDGL